MNTELWSWNENQNWVKITNSERLENPGLVLFFFGSRIKDLEKRYLEIKNLFPNSFIAGCSTSGEILEEELSDNGISLAAIQLDKSTIQTSILSRIGKNDSFALGKELIEALSKEGLNSVLLLSVGHGINGSELIRGVSESLGKQIKVFGGLAGDGTFFEKTFVCANNVPSSDHLVAIGFYGENLKFRYGSVGGWNSFGPRRKITKSKDNVLYELDGKPALDLYKSYLGEEASRLPGSALLFPLQIFSAENPDKKVVRTILSVNEEEKSMTFAGNIPSNHFAQLMTASFENLIDGAEKAAQKSKMETDSHSLAILISCVGRKLVLGQRTVEEIEVVREVLGDNCRTVGFYSYGEISPNGELLNCDLHNQTMTITQIYEI